MRYARTFVLVSAITSAGGCGDPVPVAPEGATGGYLLPRRSPFPEVLALDAPNPRGVVLRYEDRVNRDGRGTRCAVSTLLFDVTTAPMNPVLNIDNENGCRLYTSAPETFYPRQRHVCAGALSIRSGGLDTTLTFCPLMGATRVAWDQDLPGCGNFSGDRRATVRSMDEGVEGDVVTDLNGTVEFPTAVRITGPSTLAVTSWPASGDLVVTWESAMATSALLRLELADVPDPSASPVVICNPARQGRVVIRQDMIAQGTFRTQNARVRVWSFRDTDTRAMGNTVYRMTGAMVSNLWLQGRN